MSAQEFTESSAVPGIALNGVTVKYGRRRGVSGVSLDLDRPGRVIGLFGPNGAGKTTLIRVLAGLISRYQGTLVQPVGATVAFLPDEPYLYEWLRLDELLGLFAGRYPDFREDAARAVLASLGLETQMRLKECSRGMSEQVHIALTIARSPALYALDEPLGAIDPATRRKVLRLISDFRSPSSTTLISTHLIDSVASVFDDVVVISDGQVVLDETVERATASGERSLEELYLETVGL